MWSPSECGTLHMSQAREAGPAPKQTTSAGYLLQMRSPDKKTQCYFHKVVSFSQQPVLLRQQNLTLPGFFALVKAQLTKIHSASNDSSSENMAFIMMQYIDTHYSDPLLSRQTFSSHFHISEAYTSRFFKEYTGYQFSEYVTKVRMEAACNLLSATSMTVEKISAQVGYNSDVSFRRAFKAYMGITPKEYKISLTNQKNS